MAKCRGGLVFLGGVAAALLAGWLGLPLALYQHVQQPLQFSHVMHTDGSVELSCGTCHRVSAAGRFMGVPSVRECATCHQEVIGDSAEERKLIEEFIEPDREIPWLVYARQPDHVFFPHAQHTAGGAICCERCHGLHGSTDNLRPFVRNRISGYSRDIWGPRISGWGGREGESMKMGHCSACHRQSGLISSCLDCHR